MLRRLREGEEAEEDIMAGLIEEEGSRKESVMVGEDYQMKSL